MATHFIRYEFLRERTLTDGVPLDREYELNYAKNQLTKVFGIGRVTELEITEVQNENHETVWPEAQNAESE